MTFRPIKLFVASLFMLSFTAYNLNAQSSYDELISKINDSDYVGASKLASASSKEKRRDLESQILFGDIFLELEKIDSALFYYRKAEDIKSNNPLALRKVGMALTKLGKFEEGYKLLKEAVEEDDEDIESFIELGNAYVLDNKFSDAEIQFGNAKDIDDANPKIYLTLGNMYFAQRVYILAKQNYEEALSLNEDYLDARRSLAVSYYWLANQETDKDLANELFTKSLVEWDRVTQLDPNNAKAWFWKGKILHLSKRHREASKALLKYADLRPGGKLGRWYLAQSLYEIALCDSAAPHLEYVSKNIDSVRIKSRLLLARCYQEKKQYSKAYKLYSEIAQDTTYEAPDMRRYGTAALFSGDTATAIKIYREAVQKYPEQVCNMMNLVGRLLIRMKKYDDAIFFFSSRLNSEGCKDSLDSKMSYYIGYSHFFANRADSALVYLNKSLALNPNQLDAHIYLGDTYAKMEQPDSAMKEFNYVVGIAKKDTAKYSRKLRQVYSKMCAYFLGQKDYDNLIKTAKDWTEAQPTLEFGFLYMAYAYHSTGKKADACRWYQKVLEINPKSRSALKNLPKLGCG